jgi:sec-independent protein translocase protein TatA
MGRLGLTEILLILAVALLLFGGGKISELGKGLGEGIKNFKKGLADEDPPPPAAAPEAKPDPSKEERG